MNRSKRPGTSSAGSLASGKRVSISIKAVIAASPGRASSCLARHFECRKHLRQKRFSFPIQTGRVRRYTWIKNKRRSNLPGAGRPAGGGVTCTRHEHERG